MKLYWVYMVQCNDGSYYIGITNDVIRRVAEQNEGLDAHCYTFKRRPVQLVYSTDFYDPNRAIAWEKQIKGWSRRKKQALIAGDIERLVEISREIRPPK